jgi:hypothetical protein
VTLLSKEDLADIRFVAERAGGLGLNPHSTLKLLDGYEALVATLDDVSRGSTHELVRHLLEKLIAAEKEVARAPAQPAAPEPSADEEFDDFKPVSEPERREVGIVVPRAELARLRAAESQLTAVREVATHCPPNAAYWRQCDAMARIRALLTPAPEPSAEPVAKERYLLQCEVAESLRVKLQAVAEVRDKLLLLAVEFRLNPQVHSTYMECAARITKALTLNPELRPLALTEDRSEAQLKADGDDEP